MSEASASVDTVSRTSDQQTVDRLRAVVADDFGTALVAHDLSHLDRVARTAREIAGEENPTDTVTPQLVAYVHDYHRVAEHAAATSGVTSRSDPDHVWPLIERALRVAEVPEHLLPEIDAAVRFNEKSLMKGDTLDGASRTAAIVRDADKLDAVGAIGIARAFMYGGYIGETLWDPAATIADTYTSGATSSVIAHFYEKLIRVTGEMLTGGGRRLAAARVDFMIAFLEQFHAEWGDAATAPLNVSASGIDHAHRG